MQSLTLTSDLIELPPLANTIVDRAIDNVNRKLVGGYRNKNNSRPNAETVDLQSTLGDTLQATSATSVMAVANRGIAWKEVISKSLSRGISSLSTMEFDGQISIRNGSTDELKQIPNTPGVYVVYDAQNQPVYVGDSTNMWQRWNQHLNEYRQQERQGGRYKLAAEFDTGCTVRFLRMDSEVTAAALEAHLIRTENLRINAREELKYEQGKRSNIEAKKIKDASGSSTSLLAGAAGEAALNSGWVILEQLSAAILKALKNELVDVFGGGQTTLLERIKRFFNSIWSVLKQIISSPLKLLEGCFEFIVNALSQAFSQIYQLARNLLDLANAGWQLFKGARTMSTEELVEKLTEVVVVSGTLVIWDALDPIIEAQLLPLTGPAAPYLAATISAIGFGVSSYYLQQFVPQIVRFLVNCKTQHHYAVEAQRAACEQLISVSERNFELVVLLGEYAQTSYDLVVDMQQQTEQLSSHRPVAALDIQALLAGK